MPLLPPPHDPAAPPRRWPALLPWAVAWAGMLAFDAQLDLANKALVMVLAAACAAIWAGAWASMAMAGVAVLAFNVVFVPPRGSLTVNLHQHALLLATMLGVSWIVTLLMARLRRHAARAERHARRSEQLRALGEALRVTDDPRAQATALQQALAGLGAGSTALMLAHPGSVPQITQAGERADVRLDADADAGAAVLGTVSADEAAGLQLCHEDGRPMGPGTGRHEEQAAWYLPLRGRHGPQGAALLRLPDTRVPADGVLAHAQALCDQLGAAREQATATQVAAEARASAQAQALRNTLLAAISHDHRTPLATILGAASALHDQAERLSSTQRQRLAATIVDEATQLSRLTDNTLQLARLGAPGLALHRDWESVEEIVGSVLRRVRQRDAAGLVKARVLPGLPLIHCDAVLLVQLLDNLVDNALKHGGGAAPVEVLARRAGERLLMAVRDRGPGVPLAMREHVFGTFQRGPAADPALRRGAGVGLALCRAIAQAHGGELRLRPRGHGGASFELLLPIEPAPQGPPGEGP